MEGTKSIDQAGYLASFLKKKRARTHHTQTSLAEALGFGTGQYISNIERGTRSFPVEKIPQLAKELNIDPEDLIEALVLDYRESLRKLVEDSVYG